MAKNLWIISLFGEFGEKEKIFFFLAWKISIVTHHITRKNSSTQKFYYSLKNHVYSVNFLFISVFIVSQLSLIYIYSESCKNTTKKTTWKHSVSDIFYLFDITFITYKKHVTWLVVHCVNILEQSVYCCFGCCCFGSWLPVLVKGDARDWNNIEKSETNLWKLIAIKAIHLVSKKWQKFIRSTRPQSRLNQKYAIKTVVFPLSTQ